MKNLCCLRIDIINEQVALLVNGLERGKRLRISGLMERTLERSLRMDSTTSKWRPGVING